MARLSFEELFAIAKNSNLEVEDVTKYVNLQTDMVFKCRKCGNKLISNFETVRNVNWKCPHCESQVVKKVSKPPQKNGYRIIGCDQATQNFGISVFDDGKLVYYDCFEFSGELDKRYADIMKFMDNVVVQWSPDLVVVEDIQLQQGAIGGYNVFKVLAGLLGVVKAVLAKHKVPHKEVLNKVWQAKFMIAGKDRNTQKKNVVTKVQQLFGIKVTDDVADAILIGKWAADQRSNVSVNKLF